MHHFSGFGNDAILKIVENNDMNKRDEDQWNFTHFKKINRSWSKVACCVFIERVIIVPTAKYLISDDIGELLHKCPNCSTKITQDRWVLRSIQGGNWMRKPCFDHKYFQVPKRAECWVSTVWLLLVIRPLWPLVNYSVPLISLGVTQWVLPEANK